MTLGYSEMPANVKCCSVHGIYSDHLGIIDLMSHSRCHLVVKSALVSVEGSLFTGFLSPWPTDQ